MRKLSIVLSAVAVLFAAETCNAQVLYGSLTRNVTDPSSAAIPAVKVEAANVETGVTRQAETDARGAYLFSNLQLGTYKVTVEPKGFQTSVVEGVRVNANEVRRVDFKVQIAQATQSVEVLANA